MSSCTYCGEQSLNSAQGECSKCGRKTSVPWGVPEGRIDCTIFRRRALGLTAVWFLGTSFAIPLVAKLSALAAEDHRRAALIALASLFVLLAIAFEATIGWCLFCL